MTLTNTETAEYPEDLVKVAGDVCKAMGIASSVINAMPILNALVAERQRCASIAEVATFQTVDGEWPVEYREEIAAFIRGEAK